MRKLKDIVIKRAVVLLNMGGPSNLFEVETFLKNMFADPYILQVKSTFIRKIIGSIIVNKRLDEAKKNYQAIGGKSPITSITYALTQKLNELDPSTYYTYAMRYTPPYADMVVMDLIHRGIEEIVLFSMYPQHSQTTIQSSLEDFYNAVKKHHYRPKISSIDSYPTHPEYIALIASQISQAIREKNPQEYSLILSAHGLPQSIIERGDLYQKHLESTKKTLQEKLFNQGITFKEIILSYQSKLGPMKWLEPSTKNIAITKTKLLIYPIAFTIDNSETLFELDIELATLLQKQGVEDFIRIPCFNDSEEFAKMIINLTKGK